MPESNFTKKIIVYIIVAFNCIIITDDNDVVIHFILVTIVYRWLGYGEYCQIQVTSDLSAIEDVGEK